MTAGRKKIRGEALSKIRAALIHIRELEPKPEGDRTAENLKELLQEYLPVIEEARQKKGYSYEEIVAYVNENHLKDTGYELTLSSFRGVMGRIKAKAKKPVGGVEKPKRSAVKKTVKTAPDAPGGGDRGGLSDKGESVSSEGAAVALTAVETPVEPRTLPAGTAVAESKVKGQAEVEEGAKLAGEPAGGFTDLKSKRNAMFGKGRA